MSIEGTYIEDSLKSNQKYFLKPKIENKFIPISEFFQTERSHVRNLKVLDRLFCRPLLESSHMSKELIERLFPNLEDVLAVHTKYNQRMKDRIKAGFPIGNVGDILSEMVSHIKVGHYVVYFSGPNIYFTKF